MSYDMLNPLDFVVHDFLEIMGRPLSVYYWGLQRASVQSKLNASAAAWTGVSVLLQAIAVILPMIATKLR